MKSEIRPKERLIETAERLFYTQGFNATGINQILSESKVARASLYQHFDSKEKLALAYLQNSREKWFSAFETYLSEKTEPIDKIWGAFDFLCNNMIQNEFNGCRFLNFLAEVETTSNNPLYVEILDHKTKLRKFFHDLVKQSAKKDQIVAREQAGDMIYFLFESAIVESRLYKDTWPVTNAVKALREFLQV